MRRGGDYDDLAERRDLRQTTVTASPPPPGVLDSAQFAAMAAV